MKKNIIYGLTFLLSVLILSGCGSDDKVNPIVDNTGPYAFFNATTPVTITEGGGVSCGGSTCSSGGTSCSTGTCTDSNSTLDTNGTSISVQLLKHGLVEPGELVQMLPFNLAYGSVVNTVVVTDENGRAIFEYEAPEDYGVIRGQDITIQAIYLDNEAVKPGDEDKEIDRILTQDFLLQFR